MEPIDATKYLRQMKYLPDITPLCGIFILLVTLFMIPGVGGGRGIPLPDAKHAHYEPSVNILNIIIGTNGEVHFNSYGDCYRYGDSIELNRLPALITENWHDVQSNNSKVLLSVSGRAPWSKVRDVMDVLKNSKIEVVGLVTDGAATTLDYLFIQKMYREKGLKVPASAK